MDEAKFSRWENHYPAGLGRITNGWGNRQTTRSKPRQWKSAAAQRSLSGLRVCERGGEGGVEIKGSLRDQRPAG